MADAIYPKFFEASFGGQVDLLSSNIKAVLIDSADYTYASTHEFLSDVPAAAREETSANLSGKSITNGIFNADDVTFTATSGDNCEAVVLFIDTGTASTSRLICYLDSIAGLPVTLGGDIQVTWDANGIFTAEYISPYAPITATNPDLLVPLKYASTSVDGQILFQDAACTVPVESIGDPVGGVKWDGVIVATQPTDANRPTWGGEDTGVVFNFSGYLIVNAEPSSADALMMRGLTRRNSACPFGSSATDTRAYTATDSGDFAGGVGTDSYVTFLGAAWSGEQTLTLWYDGATKRLRQDGTETASAPQSGGTANGYDFWLGALNNAGSIALEWEGDLKVAAIYRSPDATKISDAESAITGL